MVVQSQGQLFHLVRAGRTAGRLTGDLHGRKEQADERADDGDDDQKFHEGETVWRA